MFIDLSRHLIYNFMQSIRKPITNVCILCRRRDLGRSIGASADPQPSGRPRTHPIKLLAEDSVISAVRVSRYQTSSGGSPRQQSAQSTVNNQRQFSDIRCLTVDRYNLLSREPNPRLAIKPRTSVLPLVVETCTALQLFQILYFFVLNSTTVIYQ